MKISKERFMKFFITLVTIFIMWSFIFTTTRTSWSSYVYGFLFCFAIFCVLSLILFKPHKILGRALLWFPFILISIWGNLKLSNYEGVIYFFICLCLILLGRKIDWNYVFPGKVVIYSGFIVIIGIVFQIFLPAIYNTYIATFFKNTNDILYWANGYGYAGFTYQLGIEAIILIYFEAIMLYKQYNRPRVNYIFLCITIAFVFLTGKRAIVLLAILLPLVIALVSNKIDNKKAFNILCVITVIGIVSYIFVINSEMLVGSKILGRFASTVIDLENGRDITSHRTSLYDEAFSMFRNHKLFGIGFGKFRENSIYNTDVHNTYLQILCEQGILGIILFMVPLLVNLLYSIKINKLYDNRMGKVSLFIQLFFSLYGLTGNVTVNEICYIMYFISICMVDGIRNKVV